MRKGFLRSLVLVLAVGLIFGFGVSFCFAEESITITTYYPSPYGVYNQLQTNSLGVGDNDGDQGLDSDDVPTTAGDVWIKGRVGIGTTNPGATLDVAGRARMTELQLGTSATPGYVLTAAASGVGTWQGSGAISCDWTGWKGAVTFTIHHGDKRAKSYWTTIWKCDSGKITEAKYLTCTAANGDLYNAGIDCSN